MIIIVYGTEFYKEYQLPNILNADYSILVERDLFQIPRDVELKMDITERGWRFVESGEYRIRAGRVQVPEKVIREGDILDFVLEGGKQIEVLVTEAKLKFPVLKKLDLRKLDYIRFGKYPGNEIRYSFQSLISGTHAVLQRYADGFYIEDKSANGVFFKGQRICGRKKLEFGDVIQMFGLKIIYLGEMLAVGASYGSFEMDPSLAALCLPREEFQQGRRSQTEKQKYFNRSPRNLPAIPHGQVEIEAPPSPKASRERPLFLTIGPAFTMAIPMLLGCGMMILSSRLSGRSSGTFMYTGLITAVGSAVLGVFWALMNLRYARRVSREEEEQRFNAYGNYLIKIAEKLKLDYRQNCEALHQMYPPAEECCRYGEGSANLWNRNYTHKDFLFQRLGLGDLPFQMKIAVPKEKFSLIYDSLSEKPAMIQEEYTTLHQVPVGIDLMRKPLVGLVGGPGKRGSIELMHVLAAEIGANNCYTDVKMAFLYDRKKTENPRDWECMKWFPHVWSEDRGTRYMASDALEAGDVFYELANVLRVRDEQTASAARKGRVKPHYVLFIQDAGILEGELIQKYIYNYREEYGLTVFLMAETCEQLPNECEDIIQWDQQFCGYFNAMDALEKRQEVQFDTVSSRDLEAFGRRICPLRVNEVENNAEIPESLDFLSMYGAASLDELQVLDRWRKNRTYNSMKVLIGKKMGDADCFLDIHEKYHGPHGLVAGTTGSGKSETLQTYMLSLAVNFSPDDIAFFVIDFKGGGMANLFQGLPHMAGQISNLSGNQIRRAMISIKSENVRRQRIFSEYGVNNINSYTRLYKSGEAPQPVPHLLIIIDEFAELKREEPEFMQELISVAQVGRSLGVHLILATQKPSGTVDDNIWSNAKFRLCLRVQDRQDSNDMLHKPDAAYITQAGRCYLQVGNDEIYELFQSGWSGAPYDEDMLSSGNDQTAVLLTETGKAAVVGGGKQRKRRSCLHAAEPQDLTQLEALVRYIRAIAVKNGYDREMRLWLPVLPEKLYLKDLSGFEEQDYFQGGWKGQEGVFELSALAGLFDDPFHQAQIPMNVDFASGGHCAVCGTVVSGKSTFLQTLLYSLSSRYSPEALQIYGADFSSRMLAPFEKLPHTGGIVYENQEEKLRRLFHLMEKFLEERKKLFQGGNYAQYVRAYGRKLPAVLLVIDNFAGFKEKTSNAYEDPLIRLAREGVAHGIFLLITSGGFGLSEIQNRIGDHIRTVISLEMGDKFKYMDVLRTTHIPVLPEINKKGRGLACLNGELLEFQTALAVEAEDDFERGRRIEEAACAMGRDWTGNRAKRIPEIPQEPVLDEFSALEEYQEENRPGESMPYAYNLTDASVYSLKLFGSYCYGCYGRKRTGKTNALKLLLHAAWSQEAEVALIETEGAELRKTAAEYGIRYAQSPAEVFEVLKELLPVFAKRNKKKQKFLAEGMSDEEIFREMKKEQTRCIFIADLAGFIKMIYGKNQGVGDMHGFIENIFEKGSLHNIYFFACMNTETAAEISGYRAARLFTGYKRGVLLGGNPAAQRIFSFRNIPYGEMNRTMKKGLGLVPEEEDETEARRIVLPLARRQKA